MKLYKCKLSDLGTVNRGKSKHRPRNDASLFGGEYPFIQTGEVKATEFYLNSFSETYNEKGLAQSKLWDKGTLLITISANIAETAILDIKACFPDSIIGFIPFENKSDVRFVKYYMEYIKKKLQNISQGTTQDNMSVKKLLSMWLYVPDYENQVKIASILSNYDKLIENNNQRIKLLESMAEEIYKEWFVRLRFPDFDKVEILDGVPFGWERKKLGDTNIEFIDGDRGKNYPKQNEFAENGYCLFLNTGNVTKKSFDFNKVQFVTKEKDAILRKGKLERDDIVLTTRGTIGNVSLYDSEIPYNNIRINSGMLILRCNNTILNSIYLYHYFIATKTQNDIELFTTGSAQPQLPISTLKNINILIPSMNILNQFLHIIESKYKLIGLLRNKNKNLKETRDLLLPKLIHGTLKV
jgi:type I restriction enzyme S subunit